METAPRDYSLLGRDAAMAVTRGLATAEWYRTPINRQTLKSLMRRHDGPALRDTALWLGALALSGALGVYFWGSWAAVPCFFVYGALYGGSSDSRWHECGHGTAFRTPWMNAVIYHLACFMVLREPTVWRWSHSRHHTDTLIVGRDPELGVPRPPSLISLFLNIFALKSSVLTLRNLVIHAAGRLLPDEPVFIPPTESRKVFWVARLYLSIFAGVGLICLMTGSLLPAMLVGLPTIYGGVLVLFFGLTQHAGLAEDVTDHRLNSRTVLMNPLFRFLYWNMNYHVEHHMYPMVPYHALPRLHDIIKHDCPEPYPNCWAAYAEIIPTLLRQRREPTFAVIRPLPIANPPRPPSTSMETGFDHRLA